jgi:branched-chain amino acid transport system permease protein
VAPFAAAVLAGPVLLIVGYFVHRLLVSRVSGTRVLTLEGEGRSARLILTLGIAPIVRNGGRVVFGASPVSIHTSPSSEAWEIGPLWGDDSSIFVNPARGTSAVVAIAVAAALYLFVTRSRVGKSLSAAADNVQAAIYMGTDVDRAHRLAFALGIGITAIAGGLLATGHAFTPYVGLDYVIIMYAGVVLGGLGSMPGAFLGGLSIGLIQQLSTLFMPTDGAMGDTRSISPDPRSLLPPQRSYP